MIFNFTITDKCFHVMPLMPILSRALQALATRAQKESQAPLGHLAPQALQGLYVIL